MLHGAVSLDYVVQLACSLWELLPEYSVDSTCYARCKHLKPFESSIQAGWDNLYVAHVIPLFLQKSCATWPSE